jgi:hypothetical protein
MFSFLIAFEPPEYSEQLTVEWKTHFKESILPQLKGRFKWSEEESGSGGHLEGEDQELVCKVMNTYGWNRGVTFWGSLRFDPVQQEPPHQEPAEGGSGLSIGAALDEIRKDGKRRSKES